MSTDEGAEGQKVDIKTLLNGILKNAKELEQNLDKEREARRKLEDDATETLVQYGKAIDGIQRGLFAMLSMHIDIVGPRRNSEDPDVAAEAKEHANMAMSAQAWVAPTLFENLYGIDADTGETLPGREAGVAVAPA
ncbi:hypothetical protein ABIE52_006791 [Rhodococcus sp. OAS809]|uniref:hypothetical protein n=1 Tax=Rhodococcus sp. OAS809 TaxID=2663874 RepID=UPI001789B6DD